MKHTLVCLMLLIGYAFMPAEPIPYKAPPQKQVSQSQLDRAITPGNIQKAGISAHKKKPQQQAVQQQAPQKPGVQKPGTPKSSIHKPGIKNQPAKQTASSRREQHSSVSLPQGKGFESQQLMRTAPFQNTYNAAAQVHRQGAHQQVTPNQLTLRTISSAQVYQYASAAMTAAGGPQYANSATRRVINSSIGYKSFVYQAFDNATPSDYSEVGSALAESGQRHMRKGKILGPDTDPGDQYPLGEPWIMAIMAALFGGVIAWRKRIVNK